MQPRRHVDAVAVNIVAINGNVAEIDADAEGQAPVLVDRFVAPRHAELNGDGAVDGADHAREFQQQPVAHGLDDAPAMLGDQLVDQL